MATFDELVKQVNDNLTKERDRGSDDTRCLII